MNKALSVDKAGDLQRTREAIVEEIQEANAKRYSSMEQLRRVHYHKLGELFIQLRLTFDKGDNGGKEFARFCDKTFPSIRRSQRLEYITYRKSLKRPTTTAGTKLPTLRSVTAPHVVDVNRPRDRYRQIVDDEVKEVKPFEVKRQPVKEENELVLELADRIINTGFRVLSVKLHPDKDGGSNDAMRRLNKAKKLLSDALLRESAGLLLS